jgi:hypothetical protein
VGGASWVVLRFGQMETSPVMCDEFASPVLHNIQRTFGA